MFSTLMTIICCRKLKTNKHKWNTFNTIANHMPQHEFWYYNHNISLFLSTINTSTNITIQSFCDSSQLSIDWLADEVMISFVIMLTSEKSSPSGRHLRQREHATTFLEEIFARPICAIHGWQLWLLASPIIQLNNVAVHSACHKRTEHNIVWRRCRW